jgi:3-phenylpropionate/trans-cinnamate dioxygenase ferredoxin reductase subunit
VLIRDERVVASDADRHTVSTESGSEYGYRTLVWAAGGHARRLGVDGEDALGVHGLRSPADAEYAKKRMSDAKHYMVLGGGFIGLEAAAALRKAGVEVIVVEFVNRLLARVTCPRVSEYFLKLHRDAAVQVRLGARAVGFEVGGGVSGVRLDSGEVLPTDGALVAVGLFPNVAVLAEAGAACSNGVEVDEFGRTSLLDVYAVGDCAFFPLAARRTSGCGSSRCRTRSTRPRTWLWESPRPIPSHTGRCRGSARTSTRRSSRLRGCAAATAMWCKCR